MTYNKGGVVTAKVVIILHIWDTTGEIFCGESSRYKT